MEQSLRSTKCAANLFEPARNLQNVKDKYVDQPTIIRETTYRIHVLPLLNRHGLKQLIFKHVCICQMFSSMLQNAMRNESVDIVALTKAHT